MSLPTDYQIHYVYQHVDPIDGEVVYVGHGSHGRAWIHGSRKSNLRSPEHLEWLLQLESLGYTADEYVQILDKRLSKTSANITEQSLIRKIQPKFNKPQGKKLLRLSFDALQKAISLRNSGKFYHEIANEVDVSTMTVYRALNNQTKNLQNVTTI